MRRAMASRSLAVGSVRASGRKEPTFRQAITRPALWTGKIPKERILFQKGSFS
jgi:hypothetical protein